jgi:hypothetical protein
VRKIPTLFKRDPADMKHVLPEVNPGCEWVLAGEGVATRKYDGTCVLVLRDGLAVTGYARREVKPGKAPPANWVEVDRDEVTGKAVGWEPIGQSGFAAFFDEAITGIDSVADGVEVLPGTYELCGPKINGNPEGFAAHVLVPHGVVECARAPRDFEALRDYLLLHTFEGIVWHHPDGRMAKLKRKDFA